MPKQSSATVTLFDEDLLFFKHTLTGVRQVTFKIDGKPGWLAQFCNTALHYQWLKD